MNARHPQELSPLKRALIALEKLQARLGALESASREPIAVIGMACRYPGGADDPGSFWRLLCAGREAIRPVPPERWDVEAFYDPDPQAPGKMYIRRGGFLERIDGLDARFFRVSPREAKRLDPQQRLFLEVAWEALEAAGQPAEALAGSRTGVFAGVLTNDYSRLLAAGGEEAVDAHFFTGTDLSFVAGRLSYFLGLQGPSLTVETACSSSLVAVHLACQSLRAGESTLALAGGVNLILSPEVSMFLCKAGAMSPSGRGRAFDRAADGMVRGEGCGVVVLKCLSKALADGDRVLAVVRGSAVNHDGASGGLTVPSGRAQAALIQSALERAGIQPDEVAYVEAHGTGTPLGDPIELRALGAVMRQGRPAGRPLWVGSLKNNIGHTDSAAGVAGLIKVVLMLQHGEIAPHVNFETPTPEVAWEDLGLAVPRERVRWPAGEAPRVAGVSAFGMSGVNAHVVVSDFTAPVPEEARAPAAARSVQVPCLLPVSAHAEEALQGRLHGLLPVLREGGCELYDLGAMASLRRSHLEHRAAFVAASRDELLQLVETTLAEGAGSAGATGRAIPGGIRKIAFAFTGQGAQWPRMGAALFTASAVFRAELEECDALIRGLAGISVIAELTAAGPASRLADTAIAQPAIFALQVGLVALFRSWGIEPGAVVGHSLGEVAAAHVAGALSLEEAAAVACHRGRLMQRATGTGRMVAVRLPLIEARELVAGYAGRLALAAHNGPRAVVLAGEPQALEEVTARLRDQGVDCRDLGVPYAFHTPGMAAFEPELTAILGGLRPSAPALPIYPTIEGEAGFGPRYWGRGLREPVGFASAVARMIADGWTDFLEIGPHPALCPHLSALLEESAAKGVALTSLRRGTDEWRSLLGTLGELYVQGHPVRFRGLYPRPGRWVDLPPYPWCRERFWAERTPRRREATAPPAGEIACCEIELGPEEPAVGARRGRLQLLDAAGGVLLELQDLRLRLHQETQTLPSPAPTGLISRLEQAAAGQRMEILSVHLASHLAALLDLDPARPIDPQQGFFDLGMDSVLATELAARLSRELGRKIPTSATFDHPCLDRLCRHLLELCGLPPGARPRCARPGEPEGEDLLTEIEELSEEGVHALLEQVLDRELDGSDHV